MLKVLEIKNFIKAYKYIKISIKISAIAIILFAICN
jgi:hypothetical protein